MPAKQSAEMRHAVNLTQPPHNLSVIVAARTAGVHRNSLHKKLKEIKDNALKERELKSMLFIKKQILI